MNASASAQLAATIAGNATAIVMYIGVLRAWQQKAAQHASLPHNLVIDLRSMLEVIAANGPRVTTAEQLAALYAAEDIDGALHTQDITDAAHAYRAAVDDLLGVVHDLCAGGHFTR